MRIRNIFPAILLAGLLTASCAVTPEEDSYYSSDRVMKAWINTHYPGLSTFANTSAYILESDPGSGASVTDSSYVCVHYVKRNLDQTILGTNIRQVSEQIGQYSAVTCYESNIWRMDQGYLPDDLETVLKSMRSGGHVKVALPMSASGHDFVLYNAFSSVSENQNQIFDLTLDTVVTDIYQYEDQRMRNWFEAHYACTDTVTEGLYFKKLVRTEAETDSIAEGNTVNIRYIVRLLDGEVFDTNIEDTAKFYRIWNSSNAYSALTFSFYKDDEKAETENSYVPGFTQSILQMNYGETAVAVFSSKLGYGEAGKSPSVPEYAPLFYWLYIEPKE